VHWEDISNKQKLSYSFIFEFREKLNLDTLLYRESIENIEEFYQFVSRYELMDI